MGIMKKCPIRSESLLYLEIIYPGTWEATYVYGVTPLIYTFDWFNVVYHNDSSCDEMLKSSLDKLIVDIETLIENGFIDGVIESIKKSIIFFNISLNTLKHRTVLFLSSDLGLKYLYGKFDDEVNRVIYEIYDTWNMIEQLPEKKKLVHDFKNKIGLENSNE